MPINFPDAPTNGQVFQGPFNALYVYDGTKWAAVAFAPVGPLSGPLGVDDSNPMTRETSDSTLRRSDNG